MVDVSASHIFLLLVFHFVGAAQVPKSSDTIFATKDIGTMVARDSFVPRLVGWKFRMSNHWVAEGSFEISWTVASTQL